MKRQRCRPSRVANSAVSFPDTCGVRDPGWAVVCFIQGARPRLWARQSPEAQPSNQGRGSRGRMCAVATVQTQGWLTHHLAGQGWHSQSRRYDSVRVRTQPSVLGVGCRVCTRCALTQGWAPPVLLFPFFLGRGGGTGAPEARGGVVLSHTLPLAMHSAPRTLNPKP